MQLQVEDEAFGRRKKTPRSSLPFSPLPSATTFLSGVLGATDFLFLAMLAPGFWGSLGAVYISIETEALVLLLMTSACPDALLDSGAR